MAVVDFGFALQLRNFASYMTRMTRVESNAKRTSKALVAFQKDVHDATVRRLAVVKDETLLERKGVPLTAQRLADLKKEKAELRLLNARLAETRKARAAEATEIGRQAREYTMLAFAMGVAAVALAKFNSANLKAALSAEKSAVALEVLTENLDIHREGVEAEIAELQELNLTRIEAEQLIAKLMNVQFDYRKASDIALAGTRLSVVANKEQAETIRTLTDSIVTMFPRQLRSLGLGDRMTDMTDALTESLETYGLELTKNERRLAIYNAILRHTSDLRGVENVLLEKAAGNLRIYNTQIKDLQQNLGEVLLPSYIEVLKAANKFLEWLNNLPTLIKTAISGLAALAGAITAVGTSIITLAAVSKIAGLTALAAGLTAALPWVGLGIIIGGIILQVSLLIKKLKDIKDLEIVPVEAVAESVQEAILKSLIEDTLAELDSRIKQIDIDLHLLEESFEIQRLKAQLILIPLRQQERSIQRQIVLWQRLTEVTIGFAEGPLKLAEVALNLLADISGDLDKALQPYEFSLRRVEASAGRILIPLRAQERSLQRQLDLLQRRIALERRSLELVLKAAELSLRGIEDQVYALDKALWPLRDVFTQISADADLVLIPLRAQERSLQRQLDLLQRRIALERRSLELVLKAAELSLRGIEDQVYALDKTLWPLRDALTQISADADLVLIPLRRQRREIERQIDRMERLSEIEQERIERHLRALEKQRDALQDIIDADRRRLDIINHEIFMEQQRNRILQRVTSARFLTMESQAAVMQDQLAIRQEEMKALNKQTRDERERLRDIRDVLDEQLEPLRERLQMLVDAITLEEDRVTFAQENLRLEEARQTAARITLEQQRRLAEEEVEQARRRLEVFDELAESRIQALENEITRVGDLIVKEEERIQQARDALELEEARQTAARITLEQQRRLAEEEIEQAQRNLDAFDELAEQRTRVLEDELLAIGDVIFLEEERIQLERDKLELARLGQTEERIALEKATSLWEDKRDEAEAHLDKVKETYELIFTALKSQSTKLGDIIFKEEERLAFMRDIKDMADATLKIEKLQWEYAKKRLSTLEEIRDLGDETTGGTTGGITTEPTVPAPIPMPAPAPIVVVPTGTPGPTVQLEAHYSNTQSPATIVDDVELMLAYAR